MAYRKKVYGQSRMEHCPLCGDPATVKNAQGIPVCTDHAKYSIELRCACGEPLDPKEGKWGTFFLCLHCGPISWVKAMEMNDVT